MSWVRSPYWPSSFFSAVSSENRHSLQTRLHCNIYWCTRRRMSFAFSVRDSVGLTSISYVPALLCVAYLQCIKHKNIQTMKKEIPCIIYVNVSLIYMTTEIISCVYVSCNINKITWNPIKLVKWVLYKHWIILIFKTSYMYLLSWLN